MNAAVLVWLSLLIAPMPQSQTASGSERPPEVNELIAKLPECSKLREELERGRFGGGVGQPYMRAMLDHGVQRAFFEIQGSWRHERGENIRIVRRLYYRQLDAPAAQITDPAALDEISRSGLETMLDEAVLTRSKNARLFAGVDRWAGVGVIDYLGWRIKGARISGSMEFFATPWLRAFRAFDRDVVGPWGLRHDLAHAAYIGDVIDLSKLLSTKKYVQSELNGALMVSVDSRWDNSAAIDGLINAGADVNARFSDETTPLMIVQCSCNIPVLLNHGARVEDHDRSGHTASDIARQRHDAVAMRLLQNTRTQ